MRNWCGALFLDNQLQSHRIEQPGHFLEADVLSLAFNSIDLLASQSGTRSQFLLGKAESSPLRG